MTDTQQSSTHPLVPPTSEGDRFDWLRLLRSYRVGLSTFYRLINAHGTARSALEALPELARSAGVDRYAPCPEARIDAELKAARAAGARLICIGEAGYPVALARIDDAPPMLWSVGDPALLQRPSVALVGARNASSLGTRMARSLARELGQAGNVVTSGLARGIDTAAHLAALETGTIAVLAGGVDVIYPAENAGLAADIARCGLLLSEQPMGMAPQARHFPSRNRIISGLARAVVVVEAAARSGSLITARDALDQGREVLAVPGHPFDARAAGCNMLIRDGAVLVRGGEDVIAALPPEEAGQREAAPSVRTQSGLAQPELPQIPPAGPPPDKRSLRETAQLHQQILSRLGPSPLAEDQLIRDLKTAPGRVAPVLLDLELEGRITRQAGGLLARLR
ncbi:DNA-processing protein DprA [Antarcticimicrobium sediminis]|uniref:DNA-protecting protein DprA n=1 Tax=Antarcticimicrobium sediminis TaxID=2546227 RepID=A0A4R5EXN8_9RHOB|nr:DNA-processing protein DprA [Antarcticimicrobium sediminis]TDE39682.1 DNA-protecting protein DprA [Antarcticimicrobium sediminis]